MTDRLPAKLEAAALIRSVQVNGGFASVLHKGDPDRGAISLLIAERGQPRAMLERRMAADFSYRWSEEPSPGGDDAAGWLAWVQHKSRIDPDCWVIELDVADAQRFIAETTGSA